MLHKHMSHVTKNIGDNNFVTATTFYNSNIDFSSRFEKRGGTIYMQASPFLIVLFLSMVKISSSSRSRTTMDTTAAAATVKAIFVHPVKSCRSIQLSHAPLTTYGFRWDRNWMVVNSKGRGYTQRVEPKLALVEVELPSEAFDEGWKPTKDSFLELKAPGMQPLKICLSKHHEVADGVSLWEWSGSAWDEGAEAAQWFSDFLGKPSRLVRFNTDSQVRLADPDYCLGHKTLFSDGYPFLIASQESLDAVNKHLEEPIKINRFRPNILVEGCEAHAEDFWKEIKIGKFSFLSVRMCYRCKVPQVSQETGVPGSEPAQTLMKMRSGKVIRPNGDNPNRTYFGQFVVWNWKDDSATGNGKVIKAGDPVHVLHKMDSYDGVAF